VPGCRTAEEARILNEVEITRTHALDVAIVGAALRCQVLDVSTGVKAESAAGIVRDVTEEALTCCSWSVRTEV